MEKLSEKSKPNGVKLSHLVEKAVQRQMTRATLKLGAQVPDGVQALIRATVLEFLLDELSLELFTLAGKGLPIQGQRRIALALGIYLPEASSEDTAFGKPGDKSE